MRLKRVDCRSPGWSRRRYGRGFVYLDADGRRLPDELAARCQALAIPPAWSDVWICPHVGGHIQAVGTDDAGRRQYLYHQLWRERRDRAKHDRVLVVAQRLPQARATVGAHLALDGFPRERALALAFRLLDLGFFRIGGEAYAEQNGSFGLATVQRRHVRIVGNEITFQYPAKSGQERLVAVADEAVRSAVVELRRRRGGGPELLAFRDGRRWRDVSSTDVNEYVKDVVGGEVSAKDFRTWHGTVLAAIALAERVSSGTSPTARRRAVRQAIGEVAEYLGNTPAVARSAYVDPRLIDRYEAGETIAPALARIAAGDLGADERRQRIERAVQRLLG